MESFIARARCIAVGASRATVEVQVEDAEGRLVVHATGQAALGPSMPRSGRPPTLERVVEPSFPSPDPPARPLTDPYTTPGIPLWRLTGITLVDLGPGVVTLSMPASEWLCNSARQIDAGASVTFLHSALTLAGGSVRLDRGLLTHDFHAALTRGWVPWTGANRPEDDGFVARATVASHHGDSVIVTGEVITTAGDKIVAGSATSTFVPWPGSSPELSSDRVLAAVLYTDIVGSTPHAERMGDARWREVLEEFHERSRRNVATFRGREVKWTGDGILATFDSPARAVQCARAMREAAQRQSIEIRAGIHVGECELIGADVAGIAVHVAQRVLDSADPGTILVTSTVREAAAGSGLRFTDRGRHALKGVDGDWQLYAVDE
jgi:acyl-coenzyme A thioesterase PaaI-like protein